MEFLKEYTISSMKLKKEKWKKIIVSDEQREYLTNFIESDFPDVMVISQNAAGHLQIHVDWPSELKYKGGGASVSRVNTLNLSSRCLLCKERSSSTSRRGKC